ncbi:hypothetical protein SAMN04487906_0509 [Zhouia amylolytica]|uniref:Uncharacterized protein n=1 Tax=Zhouia amylolytica TaxID=376730 RepID=A0A1I6Q986_9FLAO|nr:hypothetical protein [Zhouia amylolytica]SFS48860.1 hypothetical protein SAMN04487906_0509 [Zhouia amylolytica]
MLKKLFKKKPKTIREYLILVEKKPALNFQLDIIRNNLVEIQITRQRMLNKFGLSEQISNGIGISIAFTDDRNQDLERFQRSDLMKKTIHLKEFPRAYFFMCDNDSQKVINLLSEIQKKVYGYTDKTIYGYRFIRH